MASPSVKLCATSAAKFRYPDTSMAAGTVCVGGVTMGTSAPCDSPCHPPQCPQPRRCPRVPSSPCPHGVPLPHQGLSCPSPPQCPCPHWGPRVPSRTHPTPCPPPPVSLSPSGSPSTPCHPSSVPVPTGVPLHSLSPPSVSLSPSASFLPPIPVPVGIPCPPSSIPVPIRIPLAPPPQFLSPVPILPPPVSPSPPPHTRLLRHLPRRPVLATVALGGRPLPPPCRPRLLLTFAGAALGLHPWGEGQRGRGGGTSVCPVSP